jgi:DNA-binding GntR family transcriptional regulator
VKTLPTDQDSAAERAYGHIVDQLRKGALKPGDALVNRKYAATIGTSTIPLREAITRLAAEGVLEVVPGGSARVRKVDAREVGELYDVRTALEVLAVGEAARFTDDALLAELRRGCERFREIAASIAPGRKATASQHLKWFEIEERFHESLLNASQNRWLVRMARNARFLSSAFTAQLQIGQFLTRPLAERIAAQHESLLEILARGDRPAAEAWMAEHIREGRATILKLFAEAQA